MYDYSSGDKFKNPNTYMYTKFLGIDFLFDYLKVRKNAYNYLIEKSDDNKLPRDEIDASKTHVELLEIKEDYNCEQTQDAILKVENYVRRFEVAKRLRPQYPVQDVDSIASTATHILFFEVLLLSFNVTNDIRYLNVMLKLSDSLLSIKENIPIKYYHRLAQCIEKEMTLVEQLIRKMSIEFELPK